MCLGLGRAQSALHERWYEAAADRCGSGPTRFSPPWPPDVIDASVDAVEDFDVVTSQSGPVDAGCGRHSDRWVTVIEGQEVRRLRRRLGWSQKKLADQAQVGVTTVVRLERQHHAACRTWTLARIAAALCENPDTLNGRPGR